jgi:hypothetical protein
MCNFSILQLADIPKFAAVEGIGMVANFLAGIHDIDDMRWLYVQNHLKDWNGFTDGDVSKIAQMSCSERCLVCFFGEHEWSLVDAFNKFSYDRIVCCMRRMNAIKVGDLIQSMGYIVTYADGICEDYGAETYCPKKHRKHLIPRFKEFVSPVTDSNFKHATDKLHGEVSIVQIQRPDGSRVFPADGYENGGCSNFNDRISELAVLPADIVHALDLFQHSVNTRQTKRKRYFLRRKDHSDDILYGSRIRLLPVPPNVFHTLTFDADFKLARGVEKF